MSSGWAMALRGILLVALLLAIGLSRCGGEESHRGVADRAESVRAHVVRVVDGDTIEVRLPGGDSEDVRYIGIDTPETVKPGTPVQCGGPRAHEVNERLVGRRDLLLRFDAERRDAYDRLLAYVFVPGVKANGRPLFVNAELVRRGLARTLAIEPNTAHAELFSRLAERAGTLGLELWGRC